MRISVEYNTQTNCSFFEKKIYFFYNFTWTDWREFIKGKELVFCIVITDILFNQFVWTVILDVLSLTKNINFKQTNLVILQNYKQIKTIVLTKKKKCILFGCFEKEAAYI